MCRYAFPGERLGLTSREARFIHELVVVLRIEDGKVISHRDYANYDSYLAQLKSLRDVPSGG